MRQRLKDSGMSALMIPEAWFEVDACPKLGSGKTDFSAAKQLALDELARAA